MKKPRMYASLAVLAAIVLAVLFVPLPYRVFCTLEIKPRDAASVYVDVPGKLEEILVQPGDQVGPRTILARLSNLEKQLEVASLEAQEREYQAKLTTLEQLRFSDPTATQQIPAVKELLESARRQLDQLRTELARLELAAPAAGTVLPPPARPHRSEPDGQLSNWSGTPLEKRNQGAHLEESVLFCQIGDPRKFEANLVVDQEDIDFINKDQPVVIKLDELPADTFRGRIEEISIPDLRISPRQLSNKAGGELSTKTDESGVERPMSISYQARVPLDDPDGVLRIGLRGRAKISAQWQTIGWRVWRYLTHTFNFRL